MQVDRVTLALAGFTAHVHGQLQWRAHTKRFLAGGTGSQADAAVGAALPGCIPTHYGSTVLVDRQGHVHAQRWSEQAALHMRIGSCSRMHTPSA